MLTETRKKRLRALDGHDLGHVNQARESRIGDTFIKAGLLVRDYAGHHVVLRLTDAGRAALSGAS